MLSIHYEKFFKNVSEIKTLRYIKVEKTSHQQFFGKVKNRKRRKGVEVMSSGNVDPCERLNIVTTEIVTGNSNYIGKIFLYYLTL